MVRCAPSCGEQVVEVDRAWHRLVAASPVHAQKTLLQLPAHLGFSRWSAFARLGPMRCLPAFLGPDSPRRRRPFDEAHARAGFWGLSADRTADAQSLVPRRQLSWLATRWREALEQCVARGLARRLVASAQEAFSTGVALERRILREGGSLDAYRTSVVLRTTWFHVAGRAWLEVSGLSGAFSPGLEAMMLGLQLADDAVDASDDERARGSSFPKALGLRREALLALSGLALEAAAANLSQQGGIRLSRWCTRRAAAFRRLLGSPVAALGWTMVVTPLAPSLHLETGRPGRCDERSTAALP